MNSLRKWLYRPKRTDTALLAQFYFADDDLNAIAAELDSFDGRKDPERCTVLVNQLRVCQDRLLGVVQRIMEETIPTQRANRDFRVKFPDDVLQEGLAGQLWFGAECLASGSSILNREVESASMRPLARALTKNLESLRGVLRDQCLRSVTEYNDRINEALIIFDKLFAEFELSYVSAMVPVKTMKEHDMMQEVTVLFSETVQRALEIELLTQDMIDDYDPALMFTIPRLAIVCGLLVYPEGPLNPDMEPTNMTEMFRPFQTLLYKIRELLYTLSPTELTLLEKALCSSEEPHVSTPSQPIVDPNNPDSFLQIDQGFDESGEGIVAMDGLGTNIIVHTPNSGSPVTPVNSHPDISIGDLSQVSVSPSTTVVASDFTFSSDNQISVSETCSGLNKSESQDSGLQSENVSTSGMVTMDCSPLCVQEEEITSSCEPKINEDSVIKTDIPVNDCKSVNVNKNCKSESGGVESSTDVYSGREPEDCSSCVLCKSNCDCEDVCVKSCCRLESPGGREGDVGRVWGMCEEIVQELVAGILAASGATTHNTDCDTPGTSLDKPHTSIKTHLQNIPLAKENEASVRKHSASDVGSNKLSVNNLSSSNDDTMNNPALNVTENTEKNHSTCDASEASANDASALNKDSDSDKSDTVASMNKHCEGEVSDKEASVKQHSAVEAGTTGAPGESPQSPSVSSLGDTDGESGDLNEVLTDSNEVPEDSSEVPADSSEALAGSSKVPADSNEAPANSSKAPAYSNEAPAEAPTDSIEVQADSNNAPSEAKTDSREAPTDLSKAPGDTSEAPGDSSEAPTGGPSPVERQFSWQYNIQFAIPQLSLSDQEIQAAHDRHSLGSFSSDSNVSESGTAPPDSVTDFVVETLAQMNGSENVSVKPISHNRQHAKSITPRHKPQSACSKTTANDCEDSSSSQNLDSSSAHPPVQHSASKPASVAQAELTLELEQSSSDLGISNSSLRPSETLNHGQTRKLHRPKSSSKSAKRLRESLKSDSITCQTGGQGSGGEAQRCESPHIRRVKQTGSVASSCQSASSNSSECDCDKDCTCAGSETSSYNSETNDEEEIALAIQAAELASRHEARARFRSSSDMIHRLFVCIAGVADQLQTNYASDLRHILKCVFELNSTNLPESPDDPAGGDVEEVDEVDGAEESSEGESRPTSTASQSSGQNSNNRSEVTSTNSSSTPPTPSRRIFDVPPEWVPDEEVERCTACKSQFTFMRRRHHCRNCGKIFCSKCSSTTVPLPQYGHQKPVRVCHRCFLYQVTHFTVTN